MNACDTSSHGDILMCQIIIMSTDKKVVAQARLYVYTIDLEIKGQRCISYTNVHNTSSHGDPYVTNILCQYQSKRNL